jgi:hypothetical protein
MGSMDNRRYTRRMHARNNASLTSMNANRMAMEGGDGEQLAVGDGPLSHACVYWPHLPGTCTARPASLTCQAHVLPGQQASPARHAALIASLVGSSHAPSAAVTSSDTCNRWKQTMKDTDCILS